MSLAALLLVLSLPLRAEPPAEFPARTLSVGPGRRVTAAVTFDRRKAALGGAIYAAARTGAEDEDAIRMSEAVLVVSGGPLSHAAVAAREHGVPAVALSSARWEAGPALALSAPVYGPPRRSAEGIAFELVERTASGRIAEGDAVTVDPVRGAVALYPPARQAEELALAEALRAYDGLKDSQALIQWYSAREASPELAVRLAEELSARVAEGSAAPEDFLKIRRACEASLGGRGDLRGPARRAFEERLKAFPASAAEAREALAQAGSAAAVSALLADVEESRRRLGALSRAAEVEGRLAAADAALSSLCRSAEERRKSLRDASPSLAAAAAAAGASVPSGAVLPASVYRGFIAATGLDPLIAEAAGDASLPLPRKSERIASLFSAAELTPESPVGRVILGLVPSGDFFVLSGAEEASAPVGRAELLPAIKRAWASYFSPARLGARKRQGLALEPDAVVTVRKVLNAEVSGVLLTREPSSGLKDRVTVEAAWGDIAGLKSGGVPADEYVLDRRTGREAVPSLVADKRQRAQFDPLRREVRVAEVAEPAASAPCLSPAQLQKLAAAARALESHFGAALEIEFAWSQGKLLILSARPLAPRAALAPVAVETAGPEPAPDVAPVRSVR